jgi:hypothetical protein
MKEVTYDAFCDAKSLLLWAKKLLRDHRQELGGGMYAHVDRLEWVWPGEGQVMELKFTTVEGGSQMVVKFADTLEPQFAMVDRWVRAGDKIRPIVEPIASPTEAGEDAGGDTEEGLFPTDLIQRRWGTYTVDERAYATCLYECVRYEHLVHKHLPTGALEAAERRYLDLPNEVHRSTDEASVDTPTFVPRYSLGVVSSAFSNHPAIRPILEICGTYHHFVLLNGFRNSLIHVRSSKKLSASAIRKRYRRLQMAICLLQRWPWLEKLHQAIVGFDERRRPPLEGMGPLAHPCRLIKNLGADGLTKYYGLSSQDALRLEEIGALFVSKTALRPEDEYVRAISDLEKF